MPEFPDMTDWAESEASKRWTGDESAQEWLEFRAGILHTFEQLQRDDVIGAGEFHLEQRMKPTKGGPAPKGPVDYFNDGVTAAVNALPGALAAMLAKIAEGDSR